MVYFWSVLLVLSIACIVVGLVLIRRQNREKHNPGQKPWDDDQDKL